MLATWLCLGRVSSFRASPSGGGITTSKSNLFISLSPYFIPIYAILLIIIYYLIDKVFLWSFLIPPSIFMFLFGMTLTFHIVMTIDTLKVRQPDLIKAGTLTSSALIYIINLTLVAGALGLLFDSFSFQFFLNDTYFLTVDIYEAIWKQLFIIGSSI